MRTLLISFLIALAACNSKADNLRNELADLEKQMDSLRNRSNDIGQKLINYSESKQYSELSSDSAYLSMQKEYDDTKTELKWTSDKIKETRDKILVNK